MTQPRELHDLNDKVALVTGGSSGIGHAVVRALAGAGMRVATCARRLDRLHALGAELPAGSRFLPLQADLRREEDILAAFTAVRERWGGVDVLVNNAGLGHRSPLVDGSTPAWREMLDVNVLALCICTREALAQMRAKQGGTGHVIHISSMAGHRIPPDSGMYSASKYAVRSLTESLRQELRALDSPIRVTAISPGFVETEFAALYHRSEETARDIYGRYPVLQPEDIAAAVLYVLRQPAHVQIHDILLRPTGQTS